MNRNRHASIVGLLLLSTVCVLGINGCGGSGGGGKKEFVTLGTAPIGGAFRPVGDAIAGVLEENKGDNNWKVQSQSTKGSRQNIAQLDKGDIQLGMSNSAISFHAVNGTGVWKKKFNIRAVVTLAPNVGVFVAKADSGLNSIADLKGKRITVGPSGAGFNMFLGPLLTEHGVTYDDKNNGFTPVAINYTDSVGQLGDGKVDAAFLGGAIPLPALTQLSTTHDIKFIPYDDKVREKLIAAYPFFQDATVPAKNADGKPTYKGMTEDVKALDVGSMHLITTEDVPEELVYDITKTIWENREEIGNRHAGAGKAINEKNAARFTGTPFHKGAQKFYEEIGIWPKEASTAPQTAENTTTADDDKAASKAE